MEERIFLGVVKSGEYEGEKMYIYKHSWDCDWYWGFGYIGNKNLHSHFNSIFLKDPKNVFSVFNKPTMSDRKWWNIMDLFVQAYALKKAAEVYRHGGHYTGDKKITKYIADETMEKRLNKDLEKVLNAVWFLLKDTNKESIEEGENV